MKFMQQSTEKNTTKRSTAAGFLLSILFHVVLFATLFITSKLIPLTQHQTVSVEFISKPEIEEVQKNLPQKKNPTEVLKNQIVQQDQFVNNDRDEKARFLSEKDQRVTKQTQAAQRGEFKNSAQQVAPKGQTEPSKSTTRRDSSSNQQIAQNPPKMEDLFKRYDASEGIERARQKAEELPQPADRQGNVAGSEGSKGTSQEQSQTNDYLKNVDQGLQTLLNTREFKYYSYYDRIRKQLAQHWEGKVREKLSNYYKKNRAPASVNQDRVTKVIVVLNSAGTLVRVQVVGVSGIQDLDDAATEAFRAAAPFPNPPKGILEDDGTVKIRWDFVLEV